MTESVGVAVIMFVVRTLVEILNVNPGDGYVGSQRQLSVPDGVLQQGLQPEQLVFGVIVVVLTSVFILLFDVHQ